MTLFDGFAAEWGSDLPFACIGLMPLFLGSRTELSVHPCHVGVRRHWVEFRGVPWRCVGIFCFQGVSPFACHFLVRCTMLRVTIALHGCCK
jgi:hypothetical protein